MDYDSLEILPKIEPKKAFEMSLNKAIIQAIFRKKIKKGQITILYKDDKILRIKIEKR